MRLPAAKQTVREEAELMGLDLSEADIEVIADRWLTAPFCLLNDLLSGIRNLQETDRRAKLDAISEQSANDSGC